MTFLHKALIIMKFVRDYIFECLHYSQDSKHGMTETTLPQDNTLRTDVAVQHWRDADGMKQMRS